MISTKSLLFLETTIASSLPLPLAFSLGNRLATEGGATATISDVVMVVVTSSHSSPSTDIGGGGTKGSQKSQPDPATGGGGGGGGRGEAAVVVVVVVQVSELGLIGGGGGGGGVGGSGGGEGWMGGRRRWWSDSLLENWRRADPVLRSERMYIACEAESDCLALTYCFMYLFLALHLDTISSLSILE